MSDLAPIAIFAFSRIDLLARTLDALEMCEGFRQSPIHIFSDAARENRTGEVAAVQAVRAKAYEWARRNGAKVHEAPTNQGLRRSITRGVKEILEEYGRAIVLEDDIVVSKAFLRFSNDALKAYENRDDIVQVSGYFVPHKRRLPDIGLLRVPACWGWATWKRAWQYYRDDAHTLLAEIASTDVEEFDIKGSYQYLNALKRNVSGELDTWLVRWYASVYLRGGLTVYPSRSLTRNIGFVRGGTNSGPGRMAKTFNSQPVRRQMPRLDWNSIGGSENPEFAAALEDFYRWQLRQWTRPTWSERARARWNQLTALRKR